MYDTLRIESDETTPELLGMIDRHLRPHFLWCGQWKPCYAVISSYDRRRGVVRMLQPILVSYAGCAVPGDLPVRIFKPTEQILRDFVGHWRRHYPQLAIEERESVTKRKQTDVSPSVNGKKQRA